MSELQNTILLAENIHREFETANSVLPVLRGINLTLEKGETAAITGASGVGKSTLLHILGGLDRPTSGRVRISDLALEGKSETELARFRNKKVGFVFQFHYLLEDFSALENVMVPMFLAGADKRSAKERAERILGRVGLIDRAAHRPHQLSGGEQQRVAVARALANDPEILLADEPSGNLDTATGNRLHDLMFELNEDRKTSLVIATHNRELASRCQREFRMADGKLTQ